jgi:hypothetical protein
MKPSNLKIGPAIIGLICGTVGLVSSSCRGNCNTCFGCVAAGSVTLLYFLIGHKIKKLWKDKT